MASDWKLYLREVICWFRGHRPIAYTGYRSDIADVCGYCGKGFKTTDGRRDERKR